MADFLIPSVGGAPGSAGISKDPVQAPEVGSARGRTGANPSTQSTESFGESFSQILGSEIQKPVTEPLKYSAHAQARVQSRKIDVGPEQMKKLNEAINKAAAKGLDDTLILSGDTAFIVSVRNRTIVTAMDKDSLSGNVFTNIDGAVVL